MKTNNQLGFSLVELMIVVAIIGILAAIAVPNFERFQAKARQAEARTALSAIFTAENAYRAEWTRYFGDFRNIGYAPTGIYRYEHGFAAAGPNNVANYVGGGIGAGSAAVLFNTSVATVGCGAAPSTTNGCGVLRTGIPPGSFAGTSIINASGDAFIAEARGDIDGDTVVDVWTVNQSKAFTNTSDL